MPFLDWVNKQQAKQTAAAVPYRVLEFQGAHGDPSAENLLIRGDNLEALKALLPFYAGRVKCIYIDPPYNTQSAFEHYDDKLEHSQWLSMMYPRLVLLRDFLAEEGSIWVSIDDNEGHYLKVLMDEVFGRRNFVQTVIWFRKVSPANDAIRFSNDHDYIHVFSKDCTSCVVKRLPREEKHNSFFKNPDNDPRGPWNSVTLTGNKKPDERPNLFYEIIQPNTKDSIWPANGLTWRLAKEKYLELEGNSEIYWGKDGKSKAPRIKRFLSEAKEVVPRSVWLYDDVGHTQEAMNESKGLFQFENFGTPKAERLLRRILQVATNPGDLVLDSFLGSGTTAAVAHKMGRRYIGIEMGEHAETHCLPRLQKVIAGEPGGISKAVEWRGGGGFRFYSLGEPVFLADGGINPEIRFPTLAAYLWHFETGQPAGQTFDSPLLGIHGGTAYYLLYNGILGDRRPEGGNVLTGAVLAWLRDEFPHAGPKVIYGETTRLGEARQKAENLIFKQIPYDIRAR